MTVTVVQHDLSIIKGYQYINDYDKNGKSRKESMIQLLKYHTRLR